MRYTVGELAKIGGADIAGDGERLITSIAFDSRTIYSTDGVAFIALKTEKNSGEKYIADAIQKGIRTIISNTIVSDNQDITWILTDDTLSFLDNLAAFNLKKYKPETVGITGSNGKTVVKEWLYQCMSEDYCVVKSPKSYNSSIGLPLSLLKINREHQVGIFEVGISKPAEMQQRASLFSPDIGIFTHAGTAHIGNFKDLSHLIQEKIKLFRSSRLIIFEGDHPEVHKQIESLYPDRKLVSFGLSGDNAITISSDITNKSIPVTVRYFDEHITFPASKRDSATLKNVLVVIAVLKEFGYSNEKIVDKIAGLKSIEMRLESAEGVRNNLIINDYYNLDLDSLVTALQHIKEYQKEKKTLVLTDFIDAGPGGALYPSVAKLVNAQNFDYIILIGDRITQFSKDFSGTVYTFLTTEEAVTSKVFDDCEDQLILLKGSRQYRLERISALLELRKHETVLEVNLIEILHNINVHKALLKPATKVMAMVKAYSYGLGGYEVAEFLQHHHIDYLGVAYADEGVELRKKGITVPIMVMNPELSGYENLTDYQLEPEIYSFRVLELFIAQLATTNLENPYPIHIKLETGMHRLGFKREDIATLAQKIKSSNVRVASIFSHLAAADDDNERDYTLFQLSEFENLSNLLIGLLGYSPVRHILNSAGIVNFTEYQYDMVRIGIGMLGLSSNPKVQKVLQSPVTFKTRISQISELKAGETVGYNRRFTVTTDTRIATLPVGYADGLPRLAGNGRGKVGINGNLFPIIGSVCMDMMMVDLGSYDAAEGDEVVIFNHCPSLEEYARYCQTIPYEALTSISRRVKRIYIKN